MMPRPNSDVSFDFPEILDLETNHNSFWVCHLHLFFFFSKTFSKQLYIKVTQLEQSPNAVYNVLLRNGMLHKIMLLRTIYTSSKSKPSPVAIVCSWMNIDSPSSIEAYSHSASLVIRLLKNEGKVESSSFSEVVRSAIFRRWLCNPLTKLI